MKIFASDLDHTLTDVNHIISDDVKLYLQTMQAKGWVMIFITGRPFFFAKQILKDFCFPFYLGVLNGAEMFEISSDPTESEKMLFRERVDPIIFDSLEEIFDKFSFDYFILDTYESNHAYYRPKRWNRELSQYIEKLNKVNYHEFVEREQFTEAEFEKALVCKTYGYRDDLESVCREIKRRGLPLDLALTTDVNNLKYCVLFMSKAGINKGSSLKKLLDLKELNGEIIAAGDDQNDISLFRIAHKSIAISPKVKELEKEATVIADNIIDGFRLLDV